MKRSVSAVLVHIALLAATAPAAYAQKAEGDLNPTQAHGRQVLAQSCGICHLAPSLGAKTYGPVLHKATVGGSDDAMRAIIVNGTERMPAFKYYLSPSDIDAIIAYVRTVPAPVVRAAANEPQKGESR
jgi:mono/diheme cytochrome c family protein